MIDLQQLLSLILGNLGVLVLLAFIIFAGYKRWWVFGWQYDLQSQRADRFEALAFKATGVAQDATRIAKAGAKERIE